MTREGDAMHRDVLETIHKELLTRSSLGQLTAGEASELADLTQKLFQDPVTDAHKHVMFFVRELEQVQLDRKRESEILRSFLIMHGLDREYWIHYGRMMDKLNKTIEKDDEK